MPSIRSVNRGRGLDTPPEKLAILRMPRDSALTNTACDKSSSGRGTRILPQDLVADLPPEAHESLISQKTVAEVPLTGRFLNDMAGQMVEVRFETSFHKTSLP